MRCCVCTPRRSTPTTLQGLLGACGITLRRCRATTTMTSPERTHWRTSVGRVISRGLLRALLPRGRLPDAVIGLAVGVLKQGFSPRVGPGADPVLMGNHHLFTTNTQDIIELLAG